MIYQQNKIEQFVALMEQHSPQEEVNYSMIENFGTLKSSVPKRRHPTCDPPVILVVGQGRKSCFVGGKKYDFKAGDVLVLFYPMAMETEIVALPSAVVLLKYGI